MFSTTISRALINKHCNQRSLVRFLSSHSLTDGEVAVRGNYQSREYQLLVPSDNNEDAGAAGMKIVASLKANGNLVWGAKSLAESDERLSMCTPLLKRALKDIEENGEQTQAMASLNGLCNWVCKEYLDQDEEKLMNYLSQKLGTQSSESLVLVHDAVKSIATGIPRKGHSVVGQGTFRDGKPGWLSLAKDFAINSGTAYECEFYKSNDAHFISIEHLVSTERKYLSSAGGAMAAYMFADFSDQ